MTPQHLRNKSAGDLIKKQPVPPPQRPTLQGRTYSAPAGELPRPRHSKQPDGIIAAIDESNPLPYAQDASGHIPNETMVSIPSQHCLPQVNMAVVGAQGVGKSTLVKYALDLKQTPIARSSVKKMSLDGTIYLVRLLEVGIHNIAVDEHGRITWPRLLGEQALPPIDGVLALFDSADPRTLTQLSQLLSALQQTSSIPFLVVACKCDTPRRSSQHDPAVLEQANRLLAGTEALQTSIRVSESYKKCISIVLRAIIVRTSDVVSEKKRPLPKNRASSGNIPSRLRPYSSRQHTRAHSETPKGTCLHAADPYLNEGVRLDSATDSNLALNVHGSRYGRSNSQPVPPRTPPGNRVNRGSSLTVDPVPEETSPGNIAHQRLRTQWRHSAGSDAFNSFLDMEDETEDSSNQLTSPSSPNAKTKPEDPGSTFDELVDRLLSMPLTKQDAKFPSIFLCLYRKFASPSQLLYSIIGRFERMENSGVPRLKRHADQLTMLNVLAQWAAEYPGDFASPKPRKRLTDFIGFLEKNMIFAFAAKEISSCLEKFVEDDDVDWAFKDEKGEPENVETFLDTSVQSSPAASVSQNTDETIQNMAALDLNEENVDHASQYSNLSMTSTLNRSGSISSQSFKMLLGTESAHREAQRLEIVPRHTLGKTQWRIFMEIPDEDFARELTRIDWVMYSAFRPRELIRHVSTSSENKEKPSSHLENVNRMIKQFNHLAYFAASMVLLRDKAKHRAQALEKFMNISLKLRQLYNYNSLGAIIAGLNGTPIYRLAQTRALVSHSVTKQFMSLVILMGTQKSHFAYRLAWENSFGERIPFLPLHLRDLVSAEEGNRTFIGDRINWRKFEIMGDVILGVQQSQKTPFPTFHINEIVRRLVLEAKFESDEEELYTRSLQVEPSAVVGGGHERHKRFNWRRN
ncbi:RasGEF domain containing protein [Coccidioides posadasii C735 delta SOWgp]|uniref:RasGEF domain containing protein n=1 Tax=Coccidioides posadasii (strain C735) TaxID=222929 RepID=C5P0N5_COCP7|nr:RasGEF domain containing protein [Coccidioides posadasii C735 delta SOWgp]EER29243.1 RasGEF domain containing protein [Coccidioides posadasii C735 delta SOWgp]|eukprot:XP_003071388.1 RasGEF domain containing protein [Coccidioides posadasii C735 delta SOWgp]